MTTTPEPEVVESENLLTEKALLRRFVYDVTPCTMAREVATRVGLIGVSDEGHDMEHLDSHNRLDLTNPIDKPLAELLVVLSDVFDVLLQDTVDMSSMPEPTQKMLKGVFSTLIARTLASGVPVVIGNLIDLGYIDIVRGEFDTPQVVSHG